MIDFPFANYPIDCNKVFSNFTTEAGQIAAFNERELVLATMVYSVRYYIEGVVLTPVATIGLFGRYFMFLSS